MNPYSPSLAEEVARLRASATLRVDGGMLSKTLHNLIIAILVRIFTRLEHLIRLWQSGHLPTPNPTRAHPPRTATPTDLRQTHRTHRTGESRPRQPVTFQPADPPINRTGRSTSRARPIHPATARRHHRARAPAAIPHTATPAARAPPHPDESRKFDIWTVRAYCVYIIPISE